MNPRDNCILGTVRVGEKGQIVIPKKAREAFGITPGTTLLVVGDKNYSGLALLQSDALANMARLLLDAVDRPENPTEE